MVPKPPISRGLSAWSVLSSGTHQVPRTRCEPHTHPVLLSAQGCLGLCVSLPCDRYPCGQS